MKFEGKITRHLTVKLIFIAFMVIIPVNIIAVVLVSMVSDSYVERLTDSYRNQLQLYVLSINRDLDTMNNRLKAFLSMDSFAGLTLDSNTDSTVLQVRLNNKITEIRSLSTLHGMSYTWDPAKEIISLSSVTKDITAQTQKEILALLYQRTRKEGIGAYDELIHVTGDAYFVQHYDFQKFSFGFIFSADYILESYYEKGHIGNDKLFFLDGLGKTEYVYDGNMPAAKNDAAEALNDTQPELDHFRNNKKYIVIEEKLDGLGYTMVQVIARDDIAQSMPFFITGLGVLAAVSFLALPLLAYFIMRWVIKPMWRLRLGMIQIEEGNLDFHLNDKNDSWQMDYIYYAFNHMVDEIRELTIESYEKDIERLQTDAINMRLQVNPHMLLNFLNTIYSLSQAGKMSEVSEFTLLLVKYFRYVLRQDEALVTVKEEMDFVLEYLKLQKIRFPESYVSVYSIDDNAYGVRIPQLLIQNFVENSIKYGLVMGSVVEILINIHIEKERLIISVCDTGNGMPEDVVASINQGEIITNRTGNHVGIWNCLRRLRLYYGEDFKFRVTSKYGEGTQVWMELPLTPVDPDAQSADVYRLHQKERSV